MSAVLAVIYVLVMFSSMMLVGLGTTRSWQAAFVGISWSTIAGFEIGFLGPILSRETILKIFPGLLLLTTMCFVAGFKYG